MEIVQDTSSIPKPLIHDLTRQELGRACAELELPKYRAEQIWHWLYVQRATSWDVMNNLSVKLRAQLAEKYAVESVTAIEMHGDPADTRKILVGLPDGERVEEVLIPAPNRRTVCVSSQIGCRFGCAFCASGQAGFRRNLAAGEMVGQILLAGRVFAEPLTNVVFMGIGEPFDNYDAVLKTVRIINHKEGLNFGARRITISTCGVIPGIEKLAAEGLQVELSVSLHAATDELRTKLMPVNARYPLDALLAACKAYFAATKRLITFEYALIRGINDQPEHAKQLAGLLRQMPGRVNLIPLSPVEEYEGEPSSEETAEMFMNILVKSGINTTLRRSKGGSLKAACGQLRFARKEN
jgi:23S rRNA (adenine2503-C2)-methyltransferase